MVAMVCICVLAFGLYYVAFFPAAATEPVVDETLQNTVATNMKKPLNLAEAVQIDIPDDPEPTEVTYIEPPKYMTPVETPETEPPTEYIPETTEPEETEPEIDYELTDAEMLAIVIYQEVGGNAHCDLCRYRVGDIVLNRVADPRFPNSIYEVLTQPYQYGRLAWTGIKWADRASNPYEADAVARARRIANDILSGNHSELYGNGYVWQAGFKQGTDGFWCCGHYFARG